MANTLLNTDQRESRMRHAVSQPQCDRAWFYMRPGETVADAIGRVRSTGWHGPIGLSLALVA